MPGLEPVAVEVEEALLGPVTGGYEEYEQEDRAVNARSIEEICQEEEGQHESAERLVRVTSVRAVGD